MKWLIAGLLAVHGTIHMIGFAKAFDLGRFPQLTQDISKPMGLVWLLAGLCILVTALLMVVGYRFWWVLGAAGVVLSYGLLLLMVYATYIIQTVVFQWF